MPKTKKKSTTASAKKGLLDHLEALLNVANFLSRYKKWYNKWETAQTTDDGGGSNPPGDPPKPPSP